MNIPEERLMAFVDGELGPTEQEAVAAAMAEDPALTARIESMRRLRRLIAAAHREVLEEPPPSHLLAGLGERGDVVDLAEARARLRGPVPWRAIGGMAACLAIGLLIGRAPTERRPSPLLATRGGDIIAGGVLAEALDKQLASTQRDEAVKIGISFRARNGRYCRTFTVRSGLAGLACRESDAWVAQTTASTSGGVAPSGPYAMAASDLPPPVATAVDAMISGAALDARGEAQAKARGWRD